MNKPVTIIIPTKNNYQLTKQCIDSIINNIKKNQNISIIVVDNDSREEEKKLFNQLNDIVYIELNKNYGYGQAINTALMTCEEGTDFIILNNDTVLLENTIETLQKVSYDNNKFGVVGPIMLYQDGKIQSSGGFLTSNGWGNHNRDIPKNDREVEYVPGACIYIKEEIIKKLNGRLFDEDFFPAYSEDVYLGYKIRELGYKNIVTNKCHIFHLEGMTSRNDSLSNHEKSELNYYKLINREKLYKKLENIDYTDNKKPIKVAFVGTSQGGWSYATVLRNLAKSLDKTKDVDVSIYDPNYHQHYAEPDWEIAKLKNKPKDLGRISIRYGEGSTMFLSFGNKKIGYTTHESVTTIPSEWVLQLNQMDQVWTTTEYTKKIFIKSGIIKPIFVIPHGIDFNTFNTEVKPAKLSNTKGFIFFNCDIYGPRKNIDHIIEAYVKEFTYDDDVTLLLKCNFNSMLKGIKPIQYFSRFERPDRKTPKIELIEDWVSLDTLAKFHRKSDCYVGIGNEGFGLNLAESMACGTPCICLNSGGPTEFCNENNSLLLNDGYIVPARQDFLFGQYANTHWIVPNVNEIQKNMRFAYENQDKMKKLGKNASIDIKKLTWDNVAKKCVKALKKLNKGE